VPQGKLPFYGTNQKYYPDCGNGNIKKGYCHINPPSDIQNITLLSSITAIRMNITGKWMKHFIYAQLNTKAE
jgi:hypothetical protein